MRIESSQLALASSHTEVYQRTARESLRAWVGEPPAAVRATPRPRIDAVTLSEQAKAEAAKYEPEPDDLGDFKLQQLRLLIEALTGRKIRLLSCRNLGSGGCASSPPQAQAQATTAPSAGFGVDYRRTEVRQEIEQTIVSAEGTVRTSDGREMAISVELTMSRAYQEEQSVRIALGDAARVQDPLIVNLGAGPVQLLEATFAFDLNQDGKEDALPLLGPGSAFLALDRNGNSAVDDGGELFGPSTGDGFEELRALDVDQNGWIDEADPSYRDLQVWTRDADGRDTLASLAETGIGALSLQDIESPFALKDSVNALRGQVRGTGIYLREDGAPGTVQQVDLVV